MVENFQNISKKFCRQRAPKIYMNLHPKSMVWLYWGLGSDNKIPSGWSVFGWCILHQDERGRRSLENYWGMHREIVNKVLTCHTPVKSSRIWWIQSHHSIMYGASSWRWAEVVNILENFQTILIVWFSILCHARN